MTAPRRPSPSPPSSPLSSLPDEDDEGGTTYLFSDLPIGHRLMVPEMAQAGCGAPRWKKVSRKGGSSRMVQMYG